MSPACRTSNGAIPPVSCPGMKGRRTQTCAAPPSGSPHHPTPRRRSRSSLTHRPTTDSPSPKSRATDAIEDPVSNTRLATSRRYSGVKRRRVPITGTSLSAGTHTRLTKCQQHKPNPMACTGVVGVCWRRRAQVPGLNRAGTCGLRGRGSHVDRLRGCG